MASPPAPYRELTLVAVLFGVLIGAVMTAAFVYVALRLGFSMPGSTVAAILGFAVLRGVLRKGSIVENNINQTVASGVNAASAGVAFTLPALFILGLRDPELRDFSVVPILLAAVGGACLGIVFIIPLRKQMIELERLRFPSGIAVASLLKSPGAGIRQAKLLGGGFLVAALVHVSAGVEALPVWLHLPGELKLGEWAGLPEYIPIAISVSFASLGAGLLSGRGGLPFVLGGMLAWWVIAPLSVGFGWVPTPSELQIDPASAGYTGFVTWQVIYSEMLRPMGIGVLIGGALSGVIASAPAIRAALRGLSAASKTAGVNGADEMSPRVLYFGVAMAFMVLLAASFLSDQEIGLGQAVLTALVGTVWLGLAGLIVAQATGMTDISPISGMSLIGVTLMYFLSGGNVVASIILGVAVSMGIGQCADMMSDLKSGHLIGAQPRRQQIAQFSVAWIGAPIAVGVLYLLWGSFDAPGFGEGTTLTAPQGTALASIIDSLRAGATPLDKYGAGAAVGLALGILPIGGVGVLVGLAMYLPFAITMTYGVGCFISMGLEARLGARWMGSTLVPVAAGFIIGEALTSLTIVMVRLATGG